MKESLMEMGASEAQIEIIYFGTDVKLFSPNLQDLNIRRHLGFPDNSLLVLSNRQLAEVYDIPTLFYAFAEAVKLDARLRLVIAGGGSLREFLGNLAIELKVENYVHFTGRLSDADFAIATASADIYVSTSPTDGGIAASVAEAMACEVPVIITRFGDNEKWVKEETAGLLFASGNFQELSKCITRLAGNPEFRRELGKRGREVILIENNSEIEFLKIIALYEKATTSNSGFPLKDLE
jgi:glycosyltransferase involved in cell wall biosynthesis